MYVCAFRLMKTVFTVVEIESTTGRLRGPGASDLLSSKKPPQQLNDKWTRSVASRCRFNVLPPSG